ncbi:MAG TPA: oligosaccharide flippase family protein [Candidatus Dormibacteraeota bacterium]|nr:oligosaccharide flippase family protein [Candidatus Dormibacteraeota bacterium]
MSSAVVVSRGASYLTIQTITTTVAQAVSFAILTRIITPTDVGILAIIQLITAISLSLNGAALQQATMKFVGEYHGTDESLAAGVFYQTLRVSLVLSVPIAGFIFFGSGLLAHTLLGPTGQPELFRTLSVDVLVNAGMLPVANGAVLGAKSFKASAAIGIAGGIFRQCLIILLILFLKNFIGLVYAWVLSDFALLVGYGLMAVRLLGLTKRFFPLGKLVSFSWPLTIGNLVGLAYTSFDKAILIAFVPLASLGIYNAVLFAYGAPLTIGASFSNALLPVYSSISNLGLQRCRRATWRSSRYVSLVMVPLAFGLFATAKPALTVFVGSTYVEGAVPLMVLSLSLALTSLNIALGPMLTALAETRAIMWITISSLGLALASAYVLLPPMGIVGAAVARGVAAFASLGLTIYALKRKGCMSVDGEMVWKSSVASAGMAAALIVIQILIYSTILLPVYVLVGIAVYLILLRTLKAVNTHDIQLVEKYLGPRLTLLTRLLSAILLTQT